MKVTDHQLINLIVVVAIQVTVDQKDRIQAVATQEVVTLRVIQIVGTLKHTHLSFQIAKVTKKRKSYLISQRQRKTRNLYKRLIKAGS